ncbi:MAG: hypothetical protein RM368_08700 [Nostoc sp. DedSLP03]|uniref:hypothetical protein n=1 Tax=Nostoc sp. DedSLP03 TaxID=3075400 RepID=UPI002AD421D6|nr:hypothetical protein [Nostoc sp. DedSLP03]MDZ7965042.1 hypothetical protein [Nostoc sp. DedSLP03]
MAQVQQKVYLITEQQRDALLNYLLNRPYREVANGVQFLNNAPTTIVNIEVPDEEMNNISNEHKSQNQSSNNMDIPIQTATSSEELAIFSHA